MSTPPTYPVQDVLIADIVFDDRTQSRETMDAEAVDSLIESITAAGTGYPDWHLPIVLFEDGEKFAIGDGWHRIEAARQLGRTIIVAQVRPGGLSAAREFAIGANATNGLLRTKADKRRAVQMALDDHPEKSNRQLAKLANVCRSMVDDEVKRRKTAAAKAKGVAVNATPPTGGKGAAGRASETVEAATPEADRTTRQVSKLTNDAPDTTHPEAAPDRPERGSVRTIAPPRETAQRFLQAAIVNKITDTIEDIDRGTPGGWKHCKAAFEHEDALLKLIGQVRDHGPQSAAGEPVDSKPF